MNSKRFLKSLLMMAMLAFVSCETDGTEDNNPGGGNDDDSTYTVVVNPPALFKVDGAADDSEGEFEVTWAADTKFSVYVNSTGVWVDDFSVSDLDDLEFSASSEDTDLSVGVKYIAVYPARQNEEATYADYLASFDLTAQSQSGSSTEHILNNIQLSGTFYGGDDITFAHNTAILKLSFAEVASETPESVTFAYDSYSYTLSLSNMVSNESSYTAYMMIDERESGECVETFTINYSGDENDITSIANSSVEYLGGYIYELSIESKDEVPYSVTANAPTAYSNGVAATWDENVVFSVYEKDGAFVDNFTVSDFDNSEFISVSTATELDSATEYIAVYPARSSDEEDTYAKYERKSLSTQTQADATATHLNALCQASAEFKGGEEITFAYESAIAEVSFDITADGTPQTLTLNDGTNSYVLTLESTAIGEFTAYIMVAPIENNTEITYTVDYGGDDNTSSDTITTAQDYEAGGVYTQAITVEAYVDDNPYELTATLPSAYDNGFEWISAWTNGDSFKLYKKSNNDLVDTFTYDETEQKFLSSSFATELSDQTDYIATYAASETIDLSAQTQTSSSTDHLKTTSQMSTEFKGGESAAFTYDYAILAVTFTSTSTPETLTLTNETSSSKYVLTFESPASTGDSYTAYLMIDPMAADSELSYIIDCGETTVSTFSTTLAAAYEAGVSYTQAIEDATSLTAISTADQLIAYLTTPASDAILMDDITINGETITTSTSYLAKVFDGNGHSISGFNHSAPMFSGMNSGGVVKNLTVNSPVVSGTDYMGTIVGKLMAGALVDNCEVVNGSITTTSNSNAGGIAGQSKGVISNCSFSGTVTSCNQNVGGIVGVMISDSNNECSVKDCSVDATIQFTGTSLTGAGGIVGKSQTATISGCTFEGSVTGTKNLGGMVGYTATTTGYITTIIDCVNNGSIISSGGYAAGIVANILASDKVLGCTNNGSVTISYDATSTTGYAGGIVGNAPSGSIVAGCVNSGTIGTANGDEDAITKIGCIVGTGSPTIVACYNSGILSLTSGGSFGGIIGQADGGSITSCYSNDSILTTGNNRSPIIGYNKDSAATTSECYYVDSTGTTWTNTSGTACEDIATLNGKVEAMNTAINSSDCTTYKFKVGTDTENDLPTIILSE
ncbi:MAG: GLUG motif-containing protein [Rikenellaceae bacterium]